MKRAIDIARELSRWHQKVIALAEATTTNGRRQIAHELRQMAATVDIIVERDAAPALSSGNDIPWPDAAETAEINARNIAEAAQERRRK